MVYYVCKETFSDRTLNFDKLFLLITGSKVSLERVHYTMSEEYFQLGKLPWVQLTNFTDFPLV